MDSRESHSICLLKKGHKRLKVRVGRFHLFLPPPPPFSVDMVNCRGLRLEVVLKGSCDVFVHVSETQTAFISSVKLFFSIHVVALL